MGSLPEELARWEAAARERVEYRQRRLPRLLVARLDREHHRVHQARGDACRPHRLINPVLERELHPKPPGGHQMSGAGIARLKSPACNASVGIDQCIQPPSPPMPHSYGPYPDSWSRW